MDRITAEKEIAKLRISGQILAEALASVAAAAIPGVTGADLNRLADQTIRQRGGTPAFAGYQGFPAALCVSINQQVVHGVPDTKRKLRSGDIVGLDLGVNYQGFFTDQAVTVPVGKVSAEADRLIADTRQSLQIGLDQVRAGAHTGDIGAAIQTWLEARGYGVVRQLTGHGVGRAVHEPPPIPNVGTAGDGPVLEAGMVLAIEPMVTLGDWHVKTDADGWTVVTADGSLAAHIEHTIRVMAKGYELITTTNEHHPRA